MDNKTNYLQPYVWGYVFVGIWKVISGIGGFYE